VVAITAGVVLNHQLASSERRATEAVAVRTRRILFDALKPVRLKNCELKRFGEPHDGGYLMCANLLDQVEAGYSYGVDGYDQWGCDLSRSLGVAMHEYDCFDTTAPQCPGGVRV
jgi:hypothetical protein